MAFQAKDLFERSLKLNPANDSLKIGLGSVYVYGGIAMPMEGIKLIREVADRDTTNVYAQWTLGQASYYSQQLEKAVERFKWVARLQPNNPEAILLIADIQERLGQKAEAIVWYQKLLPLVRDAELRKEVESRIASLKK
jgi:cytochrome c-type biogenesis protein CcmH/NrfG